MDAIETLAAAMLAPTVPAIGLPPESPLPYAKLSSVLAWSLTGGLLCSAAVLATQIEALRCQYFRRVHAVRAAVRRLLAPRRSRAGGSNGRVPPRSAAGSPPR